MGPRSCDIRCGHPRLCRPEILHRDVGGVFNVWWARACRAAVVSTPASSESSETPSQVVSSSDRFVTQWMSNVELWIGSSWNRSQLQDFSTPLVSMMVKRHSCRDPRRRAAESTGKSPVEYWPGGTRPGGAPVTPAEGGSVQVPLPTSGYATPRTGDRLFVRVMVGRSQCRANRVALGFIVPEPVFAGLVALDDRVPDIGRVVAGVLGWRRVATADVAADSAATKVEPPTVGC